MPPPLDRTAITVSKLKTSDQSAEKIAVDTALDENERRELRRKARSATLTALRALVGESRRDAIKEQAVALGGFSQRELSAVAQERVGARPVRVVDQQLSWALSDLKREGLVENPERGVWRLSHAGKRLDELKRMPYPEYLKTPEWGRTRAAALERAEYGCAVDLTHTEGLEVHHRTKERLGSELRTDLIVMCEACLARHREPTPAPPRIGSIPPPVPQPAAATAAGTTAAGTMAAGAAGAGAKAAGANAGEHLGDDTDAEERRPRLLRRLLAS